MEAVGGSLFFCFVCSEKAMTNRLEWNEAGQATVSVLGAKNVLSEKQQKAMGGECSKKTTRAP